MATAYLDACIVIYYTEGSETLQRTIRERLEPGDSPRPMVCSSDLVRLECRVGPLKKSDRQLLADYDRFFALPDIVTIDLTTPIYDLATEVRARHNLRTPDAIHAAAAIAYGCDEFWTNDHRLSALEPRIRIVVIPHVT